MHIKWQIPDRFLRKKLSDLSDKMQMQKSTIITATKSIIIFISE